MKRIFTLCSLFFASHVLLAQAPILMQSGTLPTGSAGSAIYQDASSYIGIGTTTPQSYLDVTYPGTFLPGTTPINLLIGANYSTTAGNGGFNYFTCSKTVYTTYPTTYTINTDFQINPVGQVTIGAAAPTGTAQTCDLIVVNHSWADPAGTDLFFANPEIATVDATGNIGMAVLNAGNASHSAAALFINSNSQMSWSSGSAWNPAFIIGDISNTIAAPIMMVTGQGLVDMGVTSQVAQVDIGKIAGVYSAGLDYIFHIGDNGATNSDFFSLEKSGLVGIGTLNSGVALTEISELHSRTIPQLVIDGGDPWYNPYIVVNKKTLGVGCDASGTYSTLALKGQTGTAINLYEVNTSGWDAQIRFVDASGNIRSVITDDLTTNDLTINPGYGGGASGTVHLEGRLQIGSEQITSGSHAGALLFVDGEMAAKSAVVTISNWSDDVFNENYPLAKLPELEGYINKNKHLPGVPAECEVLKNGISLGEMNATLLRKVEELTLYAINQQMQLDELKKQLDLLSHK